MPACKYALVRYVPDLARGEQINVGVVVMCEAPAFLGARFLPRQHAGRIRALGLAQDLGFLRDIAAEFDASALRGQPRLEGLEGPWASDSVERAALEWANTIQFSPPRAALHDDPGELLSELYQRYVVPPRRPRIRERDRGWVKARVSRTLRQAVTENAPARDPSDIVQPNRRVEGRFDEHWFDYGLDDGTLLRLIQTLSFDLQDKLVLRREVDATAWAIEDLRRADETTPVSVVTIGNGKLLANAERIYREFNAEVIRENELDPWLHSVSRALVRALAQ